MKEYGIDRLGIHARNVYHNLEAPLLVEQALMRGEGILSSTGALSVETGKYTGRSPYDKYIVDSEGVHDNINCGYDSVSGGKGRVPFRWLCRSR